MPETRPRYSQFRIAVLAILTLIAAGLVFRFWPDGGSPQPPAPPPPPPFVPPSAELLVANAGSNSIVGFAMGPSRVDETPVRIIGGGLSAEAQSGLRNPFWLTVDRGGRIFTANLGDATPQPGATGIELPRITVHEVDANGASAPFVAWDGNQLGFSNPRGLAVRRNPAALFIVSQSAQGSSVIEAALPDGGPSFGHLAGAGLALVDPAGVALDRVFNVYVADSASDSIRIYAAWQPFTECPCAPLRSIAGRNAGLDRPVSVAFDTRGNLYVTNYRQDQSNFGYISVFAPDAQGDVAPIRILGVPTGAGSQPPNLRRPIGIALDILDRLYVTQENEVLVFAPDASDNAAPIQRIQHEKLNLTAGIAIRRN
ncbi:MAG TPA: hypothetical protein VMK32_10780 [Burkholderiaceae bacterium]|nr:hypothetical protein [Burkholderiaceae bacterium]